MKTSTYICSHCMYNIIRHRYSKDFVLLYV